MIIKQSPICDESDLIVEKSGEVITINGVAHDLSTVSDTLPAYNAELSPNGHEYEHILGAINRVAGELELTIRVPHVPNAPEAHRFPSDIVNPADGVIINTEARE
jgi:hypothetical protein